MDTLIPMTDNEKFSFDVQGYMVRPGILTRKEVDVLVEQVRLIHHNPMALPAAHRDIPGGPASILIDHPQVAGVLIDLLGPLVRMESGFSIWRERGEHHEQGLHQGGSDPDDPVFGYRARAPRIHAGMVRVVFELTDVEEDDGATTFLPGSHKAAFPVPAEHMVLEGPNRSPLLRSYSCPAGSAIFFTENLVHAGPQWRRDTPRVAILHAYNHLAVNFHRQTAPTEVIKSLPREKQAWFREPWILDFSEHTRDRAQPPLTNTVDRFIGDEDLPIGVSAHPTE